MANGNGAQAAESEREETMWQVRVPRLWDDVLDGAIAAGVVMHKSEFLRKAAEKEFERLGLPLKPKSSEVLEPAAVGPFE